MSPSNNHLKTPKPSPDLQRTCHYILKSCLHPHGWKLEVKEHNGSMLFEVIRLPTAPPYYKLHSHKVHNVIPMKIKSTTIEDVLHYTLFEGNQEQLSIRSILKTPVVHLRNQQRKTIARFLPFTPKITLLRAPTGSVARLRFKEITSPLHFQIECDAEPGLQWLYAIILYSIARLEIMEADSPQLGKTEQNAPKAPAHDETVTP
jgi:hypothetical protein